MFCERRWIATERIWAVTVDNDVEEMDSYFDPHDKIAP